MRKKKQRQRRILLAIMCICFLSVVELVASFLFKNLTGNKEKMSGNDQNVQRVFQENNQENVKLQMVDVEKLSRLIENTKQIDCSYYPLEAVDELTELVEKAQKALEVSSTQDELDDYYVAIITAIQSLKDSDNIQ